MPSSTKVKGYIINIETGMITGVNAFGELIASLYQQDKSLEEIIHLSQERSRASNQERKAKIEKSVRLFIAELRKKNFKRDKIRVIKITNSLPPLINVQVDLSWRCNLKCKHCYLYKTNYIEEPLSLQEWKGIIDQLAEIGVPKLTFLGGEPLLAPNFFELSFYAYKKGFKLYTTTNGTLVTSEIAKRIVEVGYNEIDVSLDGAYPRSHEFIRGKGTFKKTLQGIKYLAKVGLKVKTATVVSKINFDEIKDLFSLGEKLGVKQMYFNALMPMESEREFWRNYEIASEDWLKLKESVKAWNRLEKTPKLFIESRFSFDKIIANNKFIDTSQYAGCKAGKRELIITPDGFAVACPLLSTERKYQTMNVRQFLIKEIWKKDEWITKLRNIDETNIKGKCCFCKYMEICKGGCHILSFFEEGDIHAPDPRCPHRIDEVKYKKERR